MHARNPSGTTSSASQERPYIVSPDIGRRRTKSPVPVLMGAAESRINLGLKVLLRFVCFLAQSPARSQAVIVLCLDQKDWRLGEIHCTHQAILKRHILLPRHCTGSERYERLYAQVAFTREQSLDATVRTP